VIDGIRFSASFIAALKLRSDAFVDRIENEIKMVIISKHLQSIGDFAYNLIGI
jgi:hypothetical protein